MWRYQFLILILTPVIVVYTIIRALKFKDPRYLLQRFCLNQFKSIPNHTKPIWIHAASVGEVIAVIPLIKSISKQYPNVTIMLTSNTNTSANIVKNQLATIPLLQHYYMPIDWKWAMKKIIKKTQPRCILVVETEIWPNLFSCSHAQNIPVIIINARLSHRTTNAKPWLLTVYKKTLRHTSKILARSIEDYDSYLQLGAQKENLKLMGNIKLASQTAQNIKSLALERNYILAASTHEDEELQLAEVWTQLINNKIVSNELLVIVPRHPERAQSIKQQIKPLLSNIAIRSHKDTISEQTQIYIADTVGELKQFMIDAQFIFMGGSLITHGGQNIIEPAQLQKAIIFGKHMFNFKDECSLLIENNAAIQVQNKKALYDSFADLMQHPEKIKQLADSAEKIIHTQGNNILQHYMLEIKKYLKLK